MIPYSELPLHIVEMIAAQDRLSWRSSYLGHTFFPELWLYPDGSHRHPDYAYHRFKVLWDFHLSMIE